MSLTAFQRYRRMKQVEEMKPENLVKEEQTLDNFTSEPLVPEELPEENPLVPEEKEEASEEPEKEETKTSNRRNKNK